MQALAYDFTQYITLPRVWRRSGVFIANFDRISHPFLVFLLLLKTDFKKTVNSNKIFIKPC